MDQPVVAGRTALEQWFIDHLTRLLNPRLGLWLLLTVILGGVLWYSGWAAKIGSVVVTAFNMTAMGYLGYRFSNALERGRRPHELWAQADALRNPPPDTSGKTAVVVVPDAAELERAWQLEQLADSMQKRRTIMVAACVIGATFMKF